MTRQGWINMAIGMIGAVVVGQLLYFTVYRQWLEPRWDEERAAVNAAFTSFKFPFEPNQANYHSSIADVERIASGKWRVTLDVESTDKLGATTQSNWTVTATKQGEQWTTEKSIAPK